MGSASTSPEGNLSHPTVKEVVFHTLQGTRKHILRFASSVVRKKSRKYSPNGGIVVIYHGRTQKIILYINQHKEKGNHRLKF